MAIYSAGSASVKIVPDFEGAQQAIKDWFASQGDINVTVRPNLDQTDLERIRTEIGDAVSTAVRPELSQADMAAIKAELDSLSGTATIHIEVDRDTLRRSIEDAVAGALGGGGAGGGGSGAAAGAAGGAASGGVLGTIGGIAGITAGIGALTELAAAASQAFGAIALVPAGLFAIGGAMLTTKVAFTDFGTALKGLFDNATTAQIQASQKALAQMAPAAADTARAVAALQPAWDGLVRSVQSAFFQNLAPALTDLAHTALPIMQQGMTDIAQGINNSLLAVIHTLIGDSGQFQTIWTNIAQAWQTGLPLLSNLTDLFVKIAAVGSEFLPRISTAFADFTGRWVAWVDAAVSSGRLYDIINNALTELDALGRALADVTSIIASIFRAAMGPGRELQALLVGLLGQLAAFMKGPQGQSALTAFFTDLNEIIKPLLPIAEQLIEIVLTQLGVILKAIEPYLPPLVNAFGEILKALEPILPLLGQMVATLLPPLLKIITELLQAIEPIIPPLVQLLQIILPPLIKLLSFLASTVGTVLVKALEILATVLADVINALVWFFQNWQRIWNDVVTFVERIWNDVVGFLRNVFGQIVGDAEKMFSELAQGLKTNVSQWEDWGAKIYDAWTGTHKGKQVFGEVNTVISNLPTIMSQAKTEFLTTWSQLLGQLRSDITTLLPKLWDQIKTDFSQHNPFGGVSSSLDGLKQKFGELTTVGSQSWHTLWTDLKGFWDSYVVPVWTTVQKTVGDVQQAIGVFFGLIGRDWDTLWSHVSDFWNTHVVPMWNDIKNAVGQVEQFFSKIFSTISDAWNTLWKNVHDRFFGGGGAQADLNNAASSGESMQQRFSTAFSFIGRDLQTLVSLIGQYIDTMIKVFQGAESLVTSAWNGMLSAVKGVVHFFVADVINGAINAFDSVSSAVGGPHIDPVPVPFADGGQVPGTAPHPRADNVLAKLTPGEWVQPNASVDYYGPGVMAALQYRQIPREAFSGLGYADGGLVTGYAGAYADGGQISAAVDGLIGQLPGTGFGQVLVAMAHKLVDALISKVDSLIAAAAAAAAAAVGGGGGSAPPAPAAAGGNVALVQSMAAQRGWTGAEWDALYNVIMRESGFNNNAQNPTSTAYGMFQFLDSTWAGFPYPKTSDPTQQTVDGLDYIAQRYGDPIGAWNHEQAYGWYDQGGFLPPGFSAVYNGTGSPEMVLNPRQQQNLARYMAASGGASGQLFRDLTVQMHTANPYQVADEIVYRLRVARRGGVYSTVGVR